MIEPPVGASSPTPPADPGRLDLRALGLPGDGAADAAIAAIMRRVHGARAIEPLLRLRRVMLVAAVILVAVALATVRSPDDAPDVPTPGGAELLAAWAESSHVPTNGELLMAVHGYAP